MASVTHGFLFLGGFTDELLRQACVFQRSKLYKSLVLGFSCVRSHQYNTR